jgi:hypothetical protein
LGIADCRLPSADCIEFAVLKDDIQIGKRHLAIGNERRQPRIVSQGNDKVFTLKLARKCFIRASFAFN